MVFNEVCTHQMVLLLCQQMRSQGVDVDVQTKPSSRPKSPDYRRPRRRRFVIRRVVLATLVTFLVVTTWSIVGALRTPGDDGVGVKLAEWGRDHGLGPVITALETIQYDLNPPKTGGAPNASVLAAGVREQHQTHGSGPSVTAIQAPMVPPVLPALPGEGVFVPVNPNSDPLIQVTYVRPDSVHTSYLTGVAWMSHRLRFVLHPGFQDPGLTPGWTQPDKVTTSQYPGLLATFNAGFKLKDAGGGYYDHGVTAGTLTAGAASFVIYRDGHATVGTWGVDVTMTPQVAFVRQNLQPLIANGTLAPNLDANVQSTWGATIGGAFSVWRSGVGVTKQGDLVYAMGDAMSVADLANVLHQAGAINAMQMDINTSWVSYMWYSKNGTGVTPHKLGQFQRPAERYLTDTSRDFFAVYAP
jgi:hypothetical protein